ncbi:O-antigen/teichoic acid export membrane protein [Bradyrhizobium sp. JR1.5]|uniref:oligosaccharide flippase family protein n=1 Tax=unclassified Bradyrhizobium TaxID=2631580 RepID=UPI003399063E
MIKTLLRHSYWNAVATFSHQASTFVSNFLVIKLLDRATYGKYALVILTAFYAASILQFAIGSTASKFVARYVNDPMRLRSTIWSCAAFTLASSCLGLGLLALTSGILARGVFVEPSLAQPLAIASLAVPGLIAMIFLIGLLQGLHDFRSLAVSSVASSVFFVAIVTGGAWAAGLTGAIWGFAAGSTLRGLIMGAVTLTVLKGRRIRRFSWRSLRHRVRHEIFRFQIPAGLAGFVTVPTLWLIPTILTRNTQNFADVASYSVLIMLKTLIVLPASVISIALQPSAEKACASHQFDQAMRVFRISSITAFAFAVTAAFFFVVFAKEVLGVFGKSFTAASSELQLVMIAAIAESLATTLYMRIQAASRMWSSIFVTLLPRDVTMLVIVAAFTTKYGLQAAIAGHVAGAIVNLAGVYWLSAKSIGSLRSQSAQMAPSIPSALGERTATR